MNNLIDKCRKEEDDDDKETASVNLSRLGVEDDKG